MRSPRDDLTRPPERLFIHIDLGDGRPVPAARLRASRDVSGRTVWDLEYGKAYLRRRDALPIDPVNLPLGDKIFEKVGWLFGAIEDSLPDSWGRRVFDAWFSQKLKEADEKPRLVSDMDRLLHAADDRVGALWFSPSPDQCPMPQKADLIEDLPGRIQSMEDLLKGLPLTARELKAVGTGSGGARPKATIQDDQGFWLAKFAISADAGLDIPGREYAAMTLLSNIPGVRAARTRLEKIEMAGGPARRAVLVRRFDRDGDIRRHYLSAGSILGIKNTDEAGSYPEFAMKLRNIGVPVADRIELYSRMAFNAMIGNRDDHPRNHGIIHTEEGWRLAPAFDVVPQPEMAEIQAMSMGKIGRMPTIENLLSQTTAFGIETEKAKSILAGIASIIVAGWRPALENAGVPDQQIDGLMPCIELAREVQGREWALSSASQSCIIQPPSQNIS